MLMSITGQLSLPLERLEAALRRVGPEWSYGRELEPKARPLASLRECPGLSSDSSSTASVPCPTGRAHSAAANIEQLDRWLDAVLNALTLDAVFGGASKHR